MRIVIDLDDTLSKTENRDYEHSQPIQSVIDKLDEVRATFPNVEVVLHTARGMNSCKGNVEMAEKKNRPAIERFLQRCGIKVDRIIFGKPLGDLYIDDKAMAARDFAASSIERYEGLSGATVERVGEMVIKTAENVREQAAWYEQARAYGIAVPAVFCVQLGKLYMEHVLGTPAYKEVDTMTLDRIVHDIRNFPALEGENDLQGYADHCEKRAEDAGVPYLLQSHDITDCGILKKRTFCHGDLSLMNIIACGYHLTYIDPSDTRGLSHWLVDAAKVRASLRWLDASLVGTKHDQRLTQYFDARFSDEELHAIKVLETTHFYRVLHSAKKHGRTDVASRLRMKFNNPFL